MQKVIETSGVPYGLSLPVSSLGLCRLIHVSNAPRCLRRLRGFREHCLICSRLCGGQLRFWLGSARDTVRQRVGVQKHIRFFVRAGGQEKRPPCSRFYRYGNLPYKNRSIFRKTRLVLAWGCRCFLPMFALLSGCAQLPYRFHGSTFQAYKVFSWYLFPYLKNVLASRFYFTIALRFCQPCERKGG